MVDDDASDATATSAEATSTATATNATKTRAWRRYGRSLWPPLMSLLPPPMPPEAGVEEGLDERNGGAGPVAAEVAERRPEELPMFRWR